MLHIAESRWEFHEGILFQSAVDQEGHSCTSDLIERLGNRAIPKLRESLAACLPLLLVGTNLMAWEENPGNFFAAPYLRL